MVNLTNCPNCGAPVELAAIRCPYCGTPYPKPREEAQAVYLDPGAIARAAHALDLGVFTSNEARRLLGLREV